MQKYHLYADKDVIKKNKILIFFLYFCNSSHNMGSTSNIEEIF